MTQKYKNWINKQIEDHQKIHIDAKSRSKWRHQCWLIYIIIFLVFCICAIFFAFAGLTFDSSNPDQYGPLDLSKSGAIAFLVVGIVLFVINTIVGIYFGFLLPQIYKESQALYMSTDDYLKLRIKYMQADLSTYTKKEIKWLYKLKYIDSAKYESELRRIRQEKSNKANTKHK